MSASGDQALVDTDIEQIMAARPNMSNRDVVAFLRILKKKLPAKTFSTNVRKAVKKRTDLLDKYFETKRGTLVDKDGESVEGNYYATFVIDSIEWMGENLRVSHFNNGDTIF